MDEPVTASVIVVVGAGPGVGRAVAHRFGLAGYDVALVARSEQGLAGLAEGLQADGITVGWSAADMTDPEAFTAAIQRLGEHAGRIDHLHFNPSRLREKDPLELTAAELLADVHLGAASLLTAVQASRPYLHSGARVTATGGATADRPWSDAASLGVQKAALRNLVTALDTRLKRDGVRAMTLTVDGTIEEGTKLSADAVAEALYDVIVHCDRRLAHRARVRREPYAAAVTAR